MASIAMIGFGEAASAFASGWGPEIAARIAAFDIKTNDLATAEAKRSDYENAGVTGTETAAEVVAGAEMVFSLVTADQAEAAGASIAAGLTGPSLCFDCNSCAPAAKVRSAEKVEKAGGRYVDVAVMAPVYPGLHRTPLLVSGPHAADALKALESLGMVAREAPGPVGTASAIKLCRSIMVKGLEAIGAECLLVARRLGVEEAVFRSMEASHPGFDWAAYVHEMTPRMVLHGTRRAAEMDAAAEMVRDQGLDGVMAQATAATEAALGRLAVDIDRDDHEAILDEMTAALTRG